MGDEENLVGSPIGKIPVISTDVAHIEHKRTTGIGVPGSRYGLTGAGLTGQVDRLRQFDITIVERGGLVKGEKQKLYLKLNGKNDGLASRPFDIHCGREGNTGQRESKGIRLHTGAQSYMKFVVRIPCGIRRIHTGNREIERPF